MASIYEFSLQVIARFRSAFDSLNVWVAGLMLASIGVGLISAYFAKCRDQFAQSNGNAILDQGNDLSAKGRIAHAGKVVKKAYALSFWTCSWLLLVVSHSILPSSPPIWQILLIDAMGNMMLLGTAFSLTRLYPGGINNFLGFLCGITLLLISWNILIGATLQIGGTSPGKLTLALPGLLMAVGVFFYLAFACAKEYAELSKQIWMVLSIYGVLQVPAYIYLIMFSGVDEEAEFVVKSLLGFGKLLQVMLFHKILQIELKNNTFAAVTISGAMKGIYLLAFVLFVLFQLHRFTGILAKPGH